MSCWFKVRSRTRCWICAVVISAGGGVLLQVGTLTGKLTGVVNRCTATGCAADSGARAFRQPLGSVPDVHRKHTHDGGGRRRRQRVVSPAQPHSIPGLCARDSTAASFRFSPLQACTCPLTSLHHVSRPANPRWSWHRSTYCRETFMDNFAFANRTVSMLLGCEQVTSQLGSSSSKHIKSAASSSLGSCNLVWAWCSRCRC